MGTLINKEILQQGLFNKELDLKELFFEYCKCAGLITQEFFGVSLEDLRKKGKSGDMPEIRAMILNKASLIFEKGISLSFIGNYFGGRDHATVLHAVNKTHQALYFSDKKYRGRYDFFSKEVDKVFEFSPKIQASQLVEYINTCSGENMFSEDKKDFLLSKIIDLALKDKYFFLSDVNKLLKEI